MHSIQFNNITTAQLAAIVAALTGAPGEATATGKTNKAATAAASATATEATKAAAPTFADLDETGKREAILTLTTKHTKKGKSADIRVLLAAFNVKAGKELPIERLDEYYGLLKRYDAGEVMEKLAGSVASDDLG